MIPAVAWQIVITPFGQAMIFLTFILVVLLVCCWAFLGGGRS